MNQKSNLVAVKVHGISESEGSTGDRSSGRSSVGVDEGSWIDLARKRVADQRPVVVGGVRVLNCLERGSETNMFEFEFDIKIRYFLRNAEKLSEIVCVCLYVCVCVELNMFGS